VNLVNPSSSSKSKAPRATRQIREAQVIDAAVQTFYRRGYSAAAIQEIADAAGMFKAGLYHYIESKEDLLFRICESVHAESIEILETVISLDLPPLERVRTYIERHVRWHLESPYMVGVFFRDWRFLTGERLEQVTEHRRGYDRTIRSLIVAAQKSGEIDPQLDSKYASFYVLAAVNAVPAWYRVDGPDSAQEIAETYAGLTVATLTGSR
jgi:TetR/AcrR family transcriptional regulator, cholesterol catabolism regulator